MIKKDKWVFVGRVKAHSRRVVGMVFLQMEGKERLVSVGEDRCVFEYDLRESSVEDGVVVQVSPHSFS